MQYITSINNQKCLEWGINATQGALFSLLYEANSWATEIIKNEKTYYFVSRNLIIQELPLFFDKPDTVYRNLKALEKVGLIEYMKSEKKDLIRITQKGKTWNFIKSEKEAKNSEINPNSEIFPKKLGNKSEKEAKNSEINPTNQDINIYQDTSNQLKEKNKKEIYKSDDELPFQSKEFIETYNDFKEMRRKKKDPYTTRAEVLVLKRLEKFSNGNEKIAIEILERSIIGGWSGVFALKDNSNQNFYEPKIRSQKELQEEFDRL
ncbi:MAG: hypothetical protein HXM47_00135 [Pseudoleptotrichia goodfellowii]|nr:hypothetical protein [Pseudoleptotrichia goodfellowii]